MTSMADRAQPVVDDPAARLLVKDAHSRMYKWPASFAGYRAKVTLNEDGRIWRGSVRLAPRKDTTVELDGADPTLQEWVRERLWTQGMHFAHSPFEESDGKYVLSFDPEEDPAVPHPRGRRVLLTGGGWSPGTAFSSISIPKSAGSLP